MGELIHGVLSEVLETDEGDEFVQAFRRATMGKEELRVIKDLEQFLKSWHGLWKAGLSIEHFRGNGRFDHLPRVDEWEKQKLGLVQELSDDFEGFDGWTHGSQKKGVIKLLEAFKKHTIGSGVLTSFKGLFDKLVETPNSNEKESDKKKCRGVGMAQEGNQCSERIDSSADIRRALQ